MCAMSLRDPLPLVGELSWEDWPAFPRRWFHRVLRNAELLDADLPVDISKHDGQMIIRVSLPGFAAEEIVCEVTADRVSIKAEHEETAEEKAEGYYCRERRQGAISRSFTLPDTIDPDQAQAEYRNGVLTIRTPMTAGPAARQIPITGEQVAATKDA